MINLSTLKKGLHIWTNQAEELVIDYLSHELVTFEGRQPVLHPSQVVQHCFTSEIDAVGHALTHSREMLEVQIDKVAELKSRDTVLMTRSPEGVQ